MHLSFVSCGGANSNTRSCTIQACIWHNLCALQVALAPVRLLYQAIGPAAMRRLVASIDIEGGTLGKGFAGFVRTYALAVCSAISG